MGIRHSDAVAIQDGACNLAAIATAFRDAIREMKTENDALNPRQDPAVRLIVQQLAFLCHVDEINTNLLLYEQLMAECLERGKL